ncbi:hypothetical protein DMB92_06080 [Campylobacter sp. MIT 99-7217]|uniref:CsgG/HfaB family protein n=1 Tax=Campylobacter sp. MIT 99-7217 TaxID=535091 RepID=UPI00115A85B8|nr:CsgG/HfaB family protein [Campylobacter sp. MIT 99-7217]TQR31258.1 hypothetical protein DMB92_06080 [Campylobacter sp. MIT 99-7217]
MKKIAIIFLGFISSFVFAEVIEERAFTPNDAGSSNINIIDLGITPLNSTGFGKDANSSFSVSTPEGTFMKISTGEGSGATRELAIKEALIEAISKMKGFSTASLKDISAIPNFEHNSQNISRLLSKATKGRIDSYEVNNVFIEPNGSYGASVSVYKILFARNEKPNLVIFNASKFQNLGDQLKQKLINNFTQSKKMNILDRTNEAYYKAEKALIESEDASSDDIYKLGNVLGADYMLVFNLKDIGKADSKSSKLTTGSKTLKADVAVDYRLIFFATREIKLANTINLQVSVKDDSVKTNEAILSQIATALSTDILNQLYPLWVASVENGEVIFEEKLEVGAIYECVSKSSTQSSQVQITKSSAKISSAKILSGQTSLGDECTLSLNKGKEANYKLGTKGGVNLGF